MRKAAKKKQKIVKVLGVSRGTIRDDLRRSRDQRGYCPRQAKYRALKRTESMTPCRMSIQGGIAFRVEVCLRYKYSPEQVSGAIMLGGFGPPHDIIYCDVLADKRAADDLWCKLRINGKLHYRHRAKGSRSKFLDRKGIEGRPPVAARHERDRGWEIDLIAGRQGSGILLSLYERKRRLDKVMRLLGKGSTEIADELITTLKCYRVLTITYDNGHEFAEHERNKKAHGAEGVCASPIPVAEKVVWRVRTSRMVVTCT